MFANKERCVPQDTPDSPHLPSLSGFSLPRSGLRRQGVVPNEFLVPRPAATLFIRQHDDAMQGMRIFRGDLLIVDRSITP